MVVQARDRGERRAPGVIVTFDGMEKPLPLRARGSRAVALLWMPLFNLCESRSLGGTATPASLVMPYGRMVGRLSSPQATFLCRITFGIPFIILHACRCALLNTLPLSRVLVALCPRATTNDEDLSSPQAAFGQRYAISERVQHQPATPYSVVPS